MSYIAFDLDALNVARDVGAAAGIPEERITHGLLRMWAWCFREKTEHVTNTHVRGFFGADCVGTLSAFGFLAQAEGFDCATDTTYRVRGAERYLRVSEARSKAGKARAASAVRDAGRLVSTPPAATSTAPAHDQQTTSTPPALTPSTEHRAPSTLKDVRTEAVDTTRSAELHQNLEPPTTAPEDWVAEDFWRWAQCKRRQAQLAVEKWPHPRKLSDWWAEAHSVASSTALQEAFYRYGEDTYWQQRTPPLPFAGFVTQWAKYLPAGGADARS